MAVNEKNNVVLRGYQRGLTAVLDDNVIRYLQDELQRIENAVRSLLVAGVEVLDKPPKNPLKGMLKYNVSPWDAIGDGSEGLALYTGNAWVRV